MSLAEAVRRARPKPNAQASRATRKNYAQSLSTELEKEVASGIRREGLRDCLPDSRGTGRDRKFSGSIGSKKIDVHYSTTGGGLLLGVSIKTINYFPSSNLANRCNDLMFESVTLHGRFPFAVLSAFLVLDIKAVNDATARRESSFVQACGKLELYSGRTGYADANEKFELVVLGVYDNSRSPPTFKVYDVRASDEEKEEEWLYSSLVSLVRSRNP